MEPYEPFLSVGVAAAAGLLIGLERERQGAGGDAPGSGFAGGARTHPLVAIAGALAALLTRQVGGVAMATAFAGVLALVALGYWRDLQTRDERGITSEVAFLVTFLLGALAASPQAISPMAQRFVAVAAAAVVVTLLLSAKPLLRPFARGLSQGDLIAGLKFLVVAVVVLPLLPNAPLGPMGALNPFKIGLFVVLVAGVDFSGYAAIRLLGADRGLGVTGLLGGLASSTAVTVAMSGRARSDPAASRGCLLAVLLAGSVMFVRIVALVAIAAPALTRFVAVPIGTMAAAAWAVSVAVYLHGKRQRTPQRIELANPFELSSALKFGVVFVLILLASKFASAHLGTGGTYAAALIAGLADVDAITLSMANLAGEAVAPEVAALSIVLAAASNTAVKAGLAVATGGWQFGRWVALASAIVLASGFGGVAVAHLT